jgi:hypothetical protein
MINTNRTAYWPSPVDCGESMCLKLTKDDREVYVLRVDQSKPYQQTPPAHDVSYDAWNYLYTGYSATVKPTQDGPIEVFYTTVPMTDSNCQALITSSDRKLPISAGTGMIYVKKCLEQPGSWVSTNIGLWNIAKPTCTLGYDEQCTLNLAAPDDSSCPHTLNEQAPLTTLPVWNIEYGTGKLLLAT